jgi:hypothetical protein
VCVNVCVYVHTRMNVQSRMHSGYTLDIFAAHAHVCARYANHHLLAMLITTRCCKRINMVSIRFIHTPRKVHMLDLYACTCIHIRKHVRRHARAYTHPDILDLPDVPGANAGFRPRSGSLLSCMQCHVGYTHTYETNKTVFLKENIKACFVNVFYLDVCK